MLGPDTPLTFDATTREVGPATPFEIAATTLGEAIAAYEAAFSAKLTPFVDAHLRDLPADLRIQARDWFVYDGRNGRGGYAVAVVVLRGERRLVPVHDMSFPLLEGDTINIGPLGC